MTKELFDHFRQLTNYPEEWKLVELKELIYDLRGGSPLEPEDFLEKGFPVLHKGAIKPFGEIEIDPKKKAFTHDAFVKKYSKSVVTRGYLAVTLRDLIPSGPSIGSMSTLYSSPYPEYILAQGAYGFLVDRERVCPEYLVWLSNTDDYRKFIRTLAVGSTQIHVRTPVFTAIPIPLPPLAEQKRIAAIAQKADRLRRTRRYALQVSDTYLQSVFLEMFGDPIANPKGWKTKLLDEISEIQGGLQLSQKRDNFQLKLPYLRVANVYRNKLDLSEIKIIGLTKDEFIRVNLQKDDILIVEGHGNAAEIGRCAVWDGSIKDCVHQNHLIRVRVNSRIVNSAYLSQYINNSGGQKYFHTSSNTTSGLNTISTGIVKQCIVPMPPLPLQEKFAQIAQKFERLRTQQREGDRQAEHLFQTLLHRAFRGELTPQDANDEPASILLEEIGAEQAQAEAEAKATTQAMGDAAEYLGTKAKQQDTEPIQLTLPGIE